MKDGNTVQGTCTYLKGDSIALRLSDQNIYGYNIREEVIWGSIQTSKPLGRPANADSCVVVNFSNGGFVCGQPTKSENGIQWMANNGYCIFFYPTDCVSSVTAVGDSTESASTLQSLRTYLKQNAASVSAKTAKAQEKHDKPYSWLRAPRYRGFVEMSYTYGSRPDAVWENGDWHDIATPGKGYTAITTSHGKLLKSGMFIGGGTGVIVWSGGDADIPFFVHLRTDLHRAIQSSAAPFIEAKAGYAVGNVNAWYVAPAIGWHFCFGRSLCGLSLTAGYELLRHDGGSLDYGGMKCAVALDF